MKKIVALLSLVLMSNSLHAAAVAGHVRFNGRPASVLVPTIVYAEPVQGARPEPGRFKMTQKNKSFAPHVLAIPVGSTVTFPNDDAFFHNVFSLSRPAPFDLGLYREGTSKNITFTAPGTYHVFCNIHPQMSATVLVLPTSYIAEADGGGNYRLNLPAGRYKLTAWSERAEPSTVEVMIGADAADLPEIVLDESKFVDTLHKNKFGQDYPKSAYDPKKN
jgi:plastocyanin